MGKASLLPFTGICFLMFDYSDCTFVYQNRKSSMFQQCHPCYFPLSFISFCFWCWTAIRLNLFSYPRTIYQIQWNYTLFPYILNFLYIFLIYNNQTYTYLFLPRQHLSLLKVSVRFMGHSVLYSVGETSSGHLSRSWSPEESHERPPLRVCKQERDSGSGHLHGGLKLKLLHLSTSVNQASSSRINLSLKKMWCNLFYI